MIRQTLSVLATTLFTGLVVALLPYGATAETLIHRAADYPGVIELHVDATDVQRGIFRVKQRIPVSAPGPITLLYPQWIPGNHAPSGPIDKLAGLTIHAGNQQLSWRRDNRNMYAFHTHVPIGADALEVAFQFISPTDADQGRVVTTPSILNLQWNTVVLYPAGYAAARIRVAPQVTLPPDWSFATTLDTTERRGDTQAFTIVTLDTLVDSPLFAGSYYRRRDLAPDTDMAVRLHIFADYPEDLEMSPAVLEAHRALMRQSFALFRAWPFDRYEFLLCLSDEIGTVGLEHRESSENCVSADYLTGWADAIDDHDLLAHELVHAWNGKHRLGAGLMTPGFEVPVQGDLLWVYEGLTEYLGFVLAARSGLLSRQQVLDAFARIAATYQLRAGRIWRPLADTTYNPIIVKRQPQAWRGWQRDEDYYSEGLLIWLEVDTRIRALSGGHRSLDDFIAAFFRADRPGSVTRGYEFKDIVTGLEAIQPYDWERFLRERIENTGTTAPINGLAEGGYRLMFSETPSEYHQKKEIHNGNTNLTYSLGLAVKNDGAVTRVIWDSPAFDAGLTRGSKLISVNGRSFSKEAILAAMRATKSGSPLELTVQSGKRVRTLLIENVGGLRYPNPERIPDQPDVLGAILSPQ